MAVDQVVPQANKNVALVRYFGNLSVLRRLVLNER